MEGAMGNYYHGFAREHIVAHRQEEDPERLQHLLDKGEQNLRFVLRKYEMSEPRRPELLPTPTTAAETRRERRRQQRRATATPGAAAEREEGGAAAGLAGEGGSDSTWTPGR
eukprot:g9289.t1